MRFIRDTWGIEMLICLCPLHWLDILYILLYISDTKQELIQNETFNMVFFGGFLHFPIPKFPLMCTLIIKTRKMMFWCLKVSLKTGDLPSIICFLGLQPRLQGGVLRH